MLHALKALAIAGALVLTSSSFGRADPTTEAAGTAVSSVHRKAPRHSKKPRRPDPWSLDYNAQALPTAPVRPVSRQDSPPIAMDITALAAASVFIGIREWGWGELSFHTYREGWFGKNTEYGGIDKLGHAWSAQALSDYLTWRLQMSGLSTFESASTAAALTSVAFLAVEIGDGFSHYGASSEDFIASVAGAGFSFLRHTVPALAEKLDYRMEYIPTGHGDALGLGDYSGKKFLLALKLSGFETFKDTPLRYLEFHAGYYTRGNFDWERAVGIPQSRTPYVGIGLNLAELLFSAPSVRDTPPGSFGRSILQHIQVPYTSIATDSFR
jgi:hypothetical protein